MINSQQIKFIICVCVCVFCVFFFVVGRGGGGGDDRAPWKPTEQALILQINLDLFLRSNFSVPKGIPVFYSDALKFWKEVKY